MNGQSPPDVVIAVPARDEETRIVDCLTAVLAAVRRARAEQVVGEVVVAVAAHRCRDQTAERARATLAAATDVRSLVWSSEASAPVGRVRSRLVERALALADDADGTDSAGDSWLFSTDADSRVPEHWLGSGLRLAADDAADLVVGLVELDERDTPAAVRRAHDAVVRAGVRPDGTHDHVYAANLAVRIAAYRAVGGFPAVVKGEEQALLTAVRAAGYRVLTTTQWRVRTSGRLTARARGGLGDLLAELASTAGQNLSRPA